MIHKILRRLLIIRLALSLVVDYWKICRIDRRLQGEEREAAVNQIYTSAGIRMRKTAFRLKGVIVKIGQFLSMRQDILPKAFTLELAGLQDELPTAPLPAIKRLLENELKNFNTPIFKHFEEDAIAAASLAQVHKAFLFDGTEVAVKVIRPGIEKLARIDLATIGLVTKVIQRIPSLSRKMNFIQMHQEFTDTISRELDCLQEIKQMKRFEEMFASNQRIKIPKVYENFSTQRVLVMEHVEGARVTDYETLSKWGIDPASIAETLLDAYFRQILVFGYIHLDPHPGNLLILPDNRLCFLDFGMVDELTAEEVKTIRWLVQSIMLGNLDGILSTFEELGFLPADANRKDLQPTLSQVLERLHNSGSQQSKPEFKHVVAGLRHFIKNSPLQLQAKYMFLIRCIGILITVLSILAPRTDWFEILYRIGPSVFNTPVQA
ncbi:ABC1 kinase family protein [Calidifontibacillus oryziterrae]|uniref:ABC1 kinase family protein n=1 Tax=Calidifontibacillus oryziterrae TaxID=1191699 RepID=UPI00035E7919|nr:AarF/UbiB family protein [Calidifontibacillus oryziterrae]